MSTGLDLLRQSGELQRKLFFEQFMSSGKVGEITCVNGVDNEDTILFERYEDFIVTFRLWSEDNCLAGNKHFVERPVEEFVREKAQEQSEKYKAFLHNLVLQKRTIEDVKKEIEEQGGDPAQVDLVPFTRFHLEEMLQPGRKRINGDRNTRIQVMMRSREIPNDLQKPAVWIYVLPKPLEVKTFYEDLETLEDREAWESTHLQPMMRDHDVGCHLPMLQRVIDVFPTVYRFPEKEVDVERAANLS
jgi:hypothetical protein